MTFLNLSEGRREGIPITFGWELDTHIVNQREGGKRIPDHSMTHLYIVECSIVQCSPFSHCKSEIWWHFCIECDVPRELLLHTDQLMPPLEIRFKWFEENELDNATIPEKQQEHSWYYECLDCRISPWPHEVILWTYKCHILFIIFFGTSFWD